MKTNRKGFPAFLKIILLMISFHYSLSQKGVNYSNLLEEVPVTIKTSNLTNTLISEIEEKSPFRGNRDFLSLATG